MFGYIKLDEYAPRKYKECFRKNYCFLCRSLDKHYGLMSRLFVSYDVTFFTVLFAEEGYLGDIKKVHCLKGGKALKKHLGEEYSKKIAALNIALAAGELRDNINDKDKLYAKVLYYCYAPVFKRVKRDYPLLWQIIEDGHKKMDEIEAKNGGIEDMEDCFAGLIERITREVFGVTDEERISYIAYIAKMLYYMDAVDDINKDNRRDSFNALRRFGTKEDYVFRNYDHMREHLAMLRSGLKRIESRGVNSGTVNRIVDFGIPEALLALCYRGVEI